MMARITRRLILLEIGFALAVGGAVAAAPALDAARFHAARASTAECSEQFLVIGSRGSGDPLRTDDGIGAPDERFVQAFRDDLRWLPSSAIVVQANRYPAVGLTHGVKDWLNLIGAGLKIGPLGAYNGSVNDGKDLLRTVLATEFRVCPLVNIILVGYSQGAQVTGDVYQSLSPEQRSHIFGVVLFGDTYFNPHGRGASGSFDHLRRGGLGQRPLYPADAAGHILSYCHALDPVCQGRWLIGGGIAAPDLIGQHTNYDTSGYPEDAARYFASLVPHVDPKKYAGNIVQWSGDRNSPKTAWLVGADLKRRWIPDAATYDCLKANGAAGPFSLPAVVLGQLPDQNGQEGKSNQWAACLAADGALSVIDPVTSELYATMPLSFNFEAKNVGTGPSGPAVVSKFIVAVRGPSGEVLDVPCGSGASTSLKAGEVFICPAYQATGFTAPGTYTYWADWLGPDGSWHTGQLGGKQTFTLVPLPSVASVDALKGMVVQAAWQGHAFIHNDWSDTFTPTGGSPSVTCGGYSDDYDSSSIKWTTTQPSQTGVSAIAPDQGTIYFEWHYTTQKLGATLSYPPFVWDTIIRLTVLGPGTNANVEVVEGWPNTAQCDGSPTPPPTSVPVVWWSNGSPPQQGCLAVSPDTDPASDSTFTFTIHFAAC